VFTIGTYSLFGQVGLVSHQRHDDVISSLLPYFVHPLACRGFRVEGLGFRVEGLNHNHVISSLSSYFVHPLACRERERRGRE
jgi:hypothetical protein